LESEDLNFNGPQMEVIKKLLEEFKTIGDILNECNVEAAKKTRAFHEEVEKLRGDNRELKDEIKKMKNNQEEMEIQVQQRDDEINYLREQVKIKQMGVVNPLNTDESFLQSGTQSIFESKKKSNPKFLRLKNASNMKENQNPGYGDQHAHNHGNGHGHGHGHGDENLSSLNQKIQTLTYENYTLRNENKTLFLQNRKAMEMAVSNRTQKILKYNEKIQNDSPSGSPKNGKRQSQSPRGSIDTGIREKPSQQNFSQTKDFNFRETVKDQSISYYSIHQPSHSTFTGNTTVINSRLPSGKKPRCESADKNNINRSKSMENINGVHPSAQRKRNQNQLFQHQLK
jgi:hypothetical protein